MPDNCTVYHRAAGCGVCEFLRSPWLTSLVDPFVPPSSLPRPLFALRSTDTRFLLLHIFDCISLARNRVSKRFNDRFLVRSRVSFQLVSFRVCSPSRVLSRISLSFCFASLVFRLVSSSPPAEICFADKRESRARGAIYW